MAQFQKTTRLSAPLDDVREFHSSIDGLVELTPGWANLRVEEVKLPAGAEGPELVEGSEIRLSVAPVPFAPRQSVTSVISERETGESRARFVDEMHDGPMAEWRHEHVFIADGDETVLTDRITYRTSYGGLADRLFRPALAVGFAYRHRTTRKIL